MQHHSRITPRRGLLAHVGSVPLVTLVPLVMGACVHSSSGGGAPVFREVEANDLAFQANDFGLLVPGDHFFIDGHITDSGADPFDGFAFRAHEPIHVEFALYTDRPGVDLAACLYDPQLGIDLACYQSFANPEIGGVDVLFGGTDFQLVLQSVFGASSYSLEIVVYPLGFRAAASDASGPALQARGAAAETAEDGTPEFDAYFEDPEADSGPEQVLLGQADLIVIDVDSGEEIARESLALTNDGMWMGIPGRSGAK